MLDDTYAHSPIQNMFELGDVYGVGYDEQRASRQPVRLGIIGVGGVAISKHIPAIMRLRSIWEPVELVAISRRNEQIGRHVAKMYGCRWYSNYSQMLKTETLDGVLVLGPDELHAEHAVACLECDIPVLIEKPITRSLVDAEKLCQFAERQNIPLMTVANKRYSAPYRRAKEFVVKGPVDDPVMYVGKFNLGYDYVDLLEAGTIHLFDLTRYFMGDVRTVRALGVNRYHRNRWRYPIDNAIISFEFTSGSIGSLYTSATSLSLKPWERIEIYGNKSWLAVEDQSELLLYDSEEGPTKSWKPVIPNTLMFDEEFGGFMGLIENFLQVIRGKESPLVSGWDGHRAYELNVATHLALSHGTSVKLPLDPVDSDHECKKWLTR